MKRSISILLPVHNNVCVQLVSELAEQAENIHGLDYEIVIVEDGSTDANCLKTNAVLTGMNKCKYIVLDQNMGRAKVRNYLADHATHSWLLFLDSDVQVADGFLQKYIDETDDFHGVICGGTDIVEDDALQKHNLRYKYEHSARYKHTPAMRSSRPYHSFATANFAISKTVMEDCRFDERFRGYGYEDVLFGKVLAEKHVPIKHIDNPVILNTFDTNKTYMRKVEEAMHTLKTFRDDLRGYSPILERAQCLICVWMMRLWHAVFGKTERKNLVSNHPWLPLLKLYKFGYYLKITVQSI